MKPAFPCARCGRPLRRQPPSATRPRRIACPRCRYLIYDYPRSAAGVLVVRDADVLLLRRAHAPRIGYLDVPGGFMEANESVEQAARRELSEETGVTLGRLEPLGFYWDTYALRGFGRFPTMNWYFVGYWGHWGHGRAREPVAADDAAAIEWVPLARLGAWKPRYSWRHMTTLFTDLKRWVRAHPQPAGRTRG